MNMSQRRFQELTEQALQWALLLLLSASFWPVPLGREKKIQKHIKGWQLRLADLSFEKISH